MANDPMPDPIARMYERVHDEWTAGTDDGEPGAFTSRTGGNAMLAVAALLAEVALRYADLDKRLRDLETRLGRSAAGG